MILLIAIKFKEMVDRFTPNKDSLPQKWRIIVSKGSRSRGLTMLNNEYLLLLELKHSHRFICLTTWISICYSNKYK